VSHNEIDAHDFKGAKRETSQIWEIKMHTQANVVVVGVVVVVVVVGLSCRR
jgi:hypothetical protein